MDSFISLFRIYNSNTRGGNDIFEEILLSIIQANVRDFPLYRFCWVNERDDDSEELYITVEVGLSQNINDIDSFFALHPLYMGCVRDFSNQLVQFSFSIPDNFQTLCKGVEYIQDPEIEQITEDEWLWLCQSYEDAILGEYYVDFLDNGLGNDLDNGLGNDLNNGLENGLEDDIPARSSTRLIKSCRVINSNRQ